MTPVLQFTRSASNNKTRAFALGVYKHSFPFRHDAIGLEIMECEHCLLYGKMFLRSYNARNSAATCRYHFAHTKKQIIFTSALH